MGAYGAETLKMTTLLDASSHHERMHETSVGSRASKVMVNVARY